MNETVQPEKRDNPFVHPIRVSWGDCDPARIAFTGRLPSFALEAIEAWWEHHIGADWFKLYMERYIGTPFVHLDLDFRSTVTPGAPLECTVSLVRIGTGSTAFRVEGRQEDTLCFEGSFVSTFVDHSCFKSIPVPADIRARIEPLVSA